MPRGRATPVTKTTRPDSRLSESFSDIIRCLLFWDEHLPHFDAQAIDKHSDDIAGNHHLNMGVDPDRVLAVFRIQTGPSLSDTLPHLDPSPGKEFYASVSSGFIVHPCLCIDYNAVYLAGLLS